MRRHGPVRGCRRGEGEGRTFPGGGVLALAGAGQVGGESLERLDRRIEADHLRAVTGTCEAGTGLVELPLAFLDDEVGLLDVDTWNVFIRFDQNTDIQDEVAERIAAIYRQTGPYAMVYFDGPVDFVLAE